MSYTPDSGSCPGRGIAAGAVDSSTGHGPSGPWTGLESSQSSRQGRAAQYGQPVVADALGTSAEEAATPLIVDVDGTLIGGDLLIEGIARLIVSSPPSLLWLPVWFARGQAVLKRKVAERASLPAATLVLNPAVLDRIAAAKAAGREVWLASASDRLVVTPLAEEVGAAGCFASDGVTNLRGREKAARLVDSFGEGGFDYAGNDRHDLFVWRKARRIIGVGLPSGLERRARALGKPISLLAGLGGGWRAWLASLRPAHWIKNTLVFAPLIASHDTVLEHWLLAACVFAMLSACASASYLLNDLVDLPNDRRHPAKRHRPMAAGRTSLASMLALGGLLAAAGLAGTFLISTISGLWISFYLIVATFYSVSLKRRLLIDVMTLTVLYMVRIVAGAAVIPVPLTPWFLGLFMFVFFTLAIAKRIRELHTQVCGQLQQGGRAWRAEDVPVVAAFGAASSAASTLIFALYIQAPQVDELYARPDLLWPICPLLLYWLGRMTLLANRGRMDHDPVLFALRDRTSWLTGLAIAAAFFAAL